MNAVILEKMLEKLYNIVLLNFIIIFKSSNYTTKFLNSCYLHFNLLSNLEERITKFDDLISKKKFLIFKWTQKTWKMFKVLFSINAFLKNDSIKVFI